MAKQKFKDKIPNPANVLNSAKGQSREGQSDIVGPWSATDLIDKESFFLPMSIDGKRWDKLFPYRILVVEPVATGDKFTGQYSIVGGSSASTSVKLVSENRFQISFEPLDSRWVFQLPITPQQLSISNPFAISNSATLRGIVEEHSGTRFKMINIAGTFGVWPFRKQVGADQQTPDSSKSFNTLFGGTLRAASALSDQIRRISNTIAGKPAGTGPSPVNVETDGFGGYAGTGYANALLLDQFLEQYAEIKKHPKASNYRLAIDMPKQNQTFLVTPVQYTYAQSVDSPNEYKFNLQLKAYKRVKISNSIGEGAQISVPSPNSLSNLQRVLNSVTEARRALGTAINLIRAVRSDINGPFTALRESSLFIKGLAGLAASVVDLPGNILADAKFAIADTFANLDQARYQALAVKEKLAGNIGKMKEFKSEREGQPLPNASDDEASLIGGLAKTSPINNLFDSPEQNFDLFNSLDINSVNFPVSVQNAIENEIARTSLITADDLKRHKATLQELAYQISNNFGTGDETFARIYKRPQPRQRLQPITIDEYDLLKKLYDAIQGLGVLTLNDDVNINQVSAYDFVKAEAQEANIPFSDSSSKIRVPVPFGLTVEQIAARYLGNQERWYEIVTLNALKSPYIDEVGFERNFLSNGDGRQLNINSAEDLFVGQKITLVSNTQPKQRRTIIDIEKINETNFLITVDGFDNLDIFTTSDDAKIQAFLPGTVNSQDQIFIPSDLPVPDDLVIRPIPATQDDELTSLSKVDLLLTSDNDIAVDSFGDFRLSFGLTNLFQALKLKFITEPGQILRHPNFGSGIRPGISVSDTTASEIFNTLSILVAQDPRFSAIENLQVNIDGPYMDIRASISVANGLGVFPISFRVAS
jgi:hypothetical protein